MYTDIRKQESAKLQQSLKSESFISVAVVTERDPDDWITGTEPMSEVQKFYIQYMCRELGEPFQDNLSKMEASRYINELHLKTGRKPIAV